MTRAENGARSYRKWSTELKSAERESKNGGKGVHRIGKTALVKPSTFSLLPLIYVLISAVQFNLSNLQNTMKILKLNWLIQFSTTTISLQYF